VRGVAAVRQLAERGGGVARLRELRDVEEVRAAQRGVAVAVARARARERNGDLQPRRGEVGGVEAERRAEAGEGAGERLAVVLGGEYQGRARGLHVVGRLRGGGEGEQRGERGRSEAGSETGHGGLLRQRGSMRSSVASLRNRWWWKAAAACSATAATSTQNSHSCSSCARSASASSGAASLGIVNRPNHRNGRRPLAES